MLSRRLQRSGQGALTLTLPGQWIKEQGLRKHDSLFIEVGGDGSLLVLTKAAHDKRQDSHSEEIRCDPGLVAERVAEMMIDAYVRGARMLQVTGDRARAMAGALRETAACLPGMTQVDESDGSLRYHCFVDASLPEADKLFSLIQSVQREACRASILEAAAAVPISCN